MQDGGGKKKKGSPAPNVEGKQIGIAEPHARWSSDPSGEPSRTRRTHCEWIWRWRLINWRSKGALRRGRREYRGRRRGGDRPRSRWRRRGWGRCWPAWEAPPRCRTPPWRTSSSPRSSTTASSAPARPTRRSPSLPVSPPTAPLRSASFLLPPPAHAHHNFHKNNTKFNHLLLSSMIQNNIKT